MATTTYVVLRESTDENGNSNGNFHVVAEDLLANNAEQARRRVAETIPDSALDNGESVSLVAVPARNWKAGRGTLKAETQRRIRSA